MVNPWLATYIAPAAGVVLVLAGALRRRLELALAGVPLLLLNPALVQLPYLGLLTNESVVISLFIPIGVLLGGGACLLWERIERLAASVETRRQGDKGTRRQGDKEHIVARSSCLPVSSSRQLAFVKIVVRALLAALALWGAWDLRDVVNPATVLATPADVAAIEWVAENTPADARFLINAAPWLSTADRGADGGWWLLPLAGRWTSTPPVLYVYGLPDYVREVRARNAVVIGFQAGHEQQLYEMLDRERIDYIYLGPRSAPLTPAMFLARAEFDKVYERDGVTIFAVRRSAPLSFQYHK